MLVTDRFVLAGEGFEEGHAAAQFRQCRQAAVEFARRQVMQHVAADQQVDRRARAQEFEVAEARKMQVA